MGPAPQLSTYQAAAQAIYEPLKAADQTALQATNTTTKNTLEAEKPQVQTDYQSAIDTLTNSVQDQTAKIQQLYANNLSGNFSGLEGNDMGELFSRANQQEGIIASTEANKLAAITTEEGNADITYQADLAALTPKYMSEEAQYANSAYGSAVSQYDTDAYHQQELGLEQERIGIEANNSANSANSATASAFKATGKTSFDPNTKSNVASTSNGYNFTGPNGTPVNMAQYLSGAGGGSVDPGQLGALLQNGSSYDKAIYGQVQNLSGDALIQAVANLDAKGTTVKGKKIGGANAYGF